jgi:hypothetical protein
MGGVMVEKGWALRWSSAMVLSVNIVVGIVLLVSVLCVGGWRVFDVRHTNLVKYLIPLP